MAAEAAPLLLVTRVGGEQLSSDTRTALGEGLALALARRLAVDVQSHESVAERLDLAARQQQLGCDSSACLTEIADALGARFVVFPRVLVLGGQQVLRVELYDSRAAQVLALVSIQGDDVDALVPRLPEVVELLITESAGGLPVRAVARAIEAAPPQQPTSPWVQRGLVTGGVGLGATLVFGSLFAVGALGASRLAAAEAAWSEDPVLDNARAVVDARGPFDRTTAVLGTCGAGCATGLGLLTTLVGAGVAGWGWFAPPDDAEESR